MKVVYVSAYDLPGQRFNGMVIHRALLSQGHESDYVVDLKYSAEDRVHALGSQLLRKLNRAANRMETRQSRQWRRRACGPLSIIPCACRAYVSLPFHFGAHELA